MATRVRRRLGFERPPANPALLIVWAPVEVLTMEWPVELSGVLVLRAGRVLIGLNRRHSPVRRHFSFWHEVGHYLLHRDSWQICQAGDGRLGGHGGRAAAPEREADVFAACLLMPDDWVRASSAELRELSTLARRFGVSPLAMARRLQELGLR